MGKPVNKAELSHEVGQVANAARQLIEAGYTGPAVEVLSALVDNVTYQLEQAGEL